MSSHGNNNNSSNGGHRKGDRTKSTTTTATDNGNRRHVPTPSSRLSYSTARTTSSSSSSPGAAALIDPSPSSSPSPSAIRTPTPPKASHVSAMATRAYQLKLELLQNPILSLRNLHKIRTAIFIHQALAAFFEDLISQGDAGDGDANNGDGDEAALIRKMPELFRVVSRKMEKARWGEVRGGGGDGGGGSGGGGGGGGWDDGREDQQQQQPKNAWIRHLIRLLVGNGAVLEEALECGMKGERAKFRFILTEQLRRDEAR